MEHLKRSNIYTNLSPKHISYQIPSAAPVCSLETVTKIH